MKKNKKVHLYEDIECDVLQVKLTPEMDKEASEFIKEYYRKNLTSDKKSKTKNPLRLKQ